MEGVLCEVVGWGGVGLGPAACGPAAVARWPAARRRRPIPLTPAPAPQTPPQELVALLGRSQGVILMAPPSDASEAQTTLGTLTSAIKAKTKVGGGCCWGC